jgi:RNA polymerase sigma factor (sigma-70 family)
MGTAAVGSPPAAVLRRHGSLLAVDDDAALLQAWRDGDGDAGDALLGRHFKGVVRFFRSKLGDDVDDIVQQTFADVVRARDRVATGGFRAYLMTVARHRLIDHLRRKARGPEIDPGADSVQSLGTSVSQRLARDEQERLLLQALRRMPLDAQIALELAYWEGMNSVEIAAVLGVGASTIRSRLTRARESLRRALEDSTAPPSLVTESLQRLDAFAASYEGGVDDGPGV